MTTFGTAIVDPPWAYRALRRTANGSLSKQTGYASQAYEDLMTVADMKTLPVGDLVTDILLMWTTGPFIPGAVELVTAWGFEWVTMGYWLKTSTNGHPQQSFEGTITYKPHMGVGYWFRGDAEPFVVAKKKGRPSYRTGLRSTFLHPVLGHSAKPDYLHAIAEQFFPGPYLELFARRPMPGWTCLGNELGERLDIREALAAL